LPTLEIAVPAELAELTTDLDEEGEGDDDSEASFDRSGLWCLLRRGVLRDGIVVDKGQLVFGCRFCFLSDMIDCVPYPE
jgi:hypothetical protein